MSYVSSWFDSDYVYVAGMSQNHGSDSAFFLFCPIRWSVILICSIIGDVYFDSLIEVCLSGFFTISLLNSLYN